MESSDPQIIKKMSQLKQSANEQLKNKLRNKLFTREQMCKILGVERHNLKDLTDQKTNVVPVTPVEVQGRTKYYSFDTLMRLHMGHLLKTNCWDNAFVKTVDNHILGMSKKKIFGKHTDPNQPKYKCLNPLDPFFLDEANECFAVLKSKHPKLMIEVFIHDHEYKFSNARFHGVMGALSAPLAGYSHYYETWQSFSPDATPEFSKGQQIILVEANKEFSLHTQLSVASRSVNLTYGHNILLQKIEIFLSNNV
jgi:hypothetical protein